MADELYDRIGGGYLRTRRADPRIAAILHDALGDASTVVNVGAGAGAYEPAPRTVAAVEPSPTMIRQRPAGRAPVVRASAGDLPFRDGSFAASLAILTIHHWPDPERGLRELARVSRDRVVLLTWDPESEGFWLTRDYFPEIVAADRGKFPRLADYRRALGPVSVRPVPVPHDCADGFLGAYWRRPRAYLRPETRAGMSTFASLPDPGPGLRALRDDLASGAWARRNADLDSRSSLDLGYRVVVAERST